MSISQRDLLEWADDRNVAITGLRALGLFGVRSKAKEYGLKRVRARVSETSIAAAERLGWMRMCLTALYFGQRDVLRPEQSFRDVSRPTLLVPPVLGTLVYGDSGDDAAPRPAWCTGRCAMFGRFFKIFCSCAKSQRNLVGYQCRGTNKLNR